MGLRMKNFNIIVVHWKIRFLGGWRGSQNRYTGWIAKKGELGQFADLGGGEA